MQQPKESGTPSIWTEHMAGEEIDQVIHKAADFVGKEAHLIKEKLTSGAPPAVGTQTAEPQSPHREEQGADWSKDIEQAEHWVADEVKKAKEFISHEAQVVKEKVGNVVHKVDEKAHEVPDEDMVDNAIDDSI